MHFICSYWYCCDVYSADKNFCTNEFSANANLGKDLLWSTALFLFDGNLHIIWCLFLSYRKIEDSFFTTNLRLNGNVVTKKGKKVWWILLYLFIPSRSKYSSFSKQHRNWEGGGMCQDLYFAWKMGQYALLLALFSCFSPNNPFFVRKISHRNAHITVAVQTPHLFQSWVTPAKLSKNEVDSNIFLHNYFKVWSLICKIKDKLEWLNMG